MVTNRKQLHERLWSAAVQLRANSGLKLNEISEPILGLIFLKFADVRFKKIHTGIVAERKAVYSPRVRPIGPDDYCYDNAPMESFWGTLKSELVHHSRYRTREEAKQEITEYIEVFYNRQRKQAKLGFLSPAVYEQQFYKRQLAV